MIIRYTIAAAIAAASASLTFIGAAAAAPAGPQNASQIVRQLEQSGNTVIVNRTGSQPLAQCAVTGIRSGQTFTRFDSGYPGAQMDPIAQAVAMTVYVDVGC